MQPIFNGRSNGFLAILLSMLSIVASVPDGVLSAQESQTAPASSSSTGQRVPLSEQELNNRVSPIALYSDALAAQILAASTFPEQVVVAANWLQQNKSLTGSALMQAVNGQSWNPSVKVGAVAVGMAAGAAAFTSEVAAVSAESAAGSGEGTGKD